MKCIACFVDEQQKAERLFCEEYEECEDNDADENGYQNTDVMTVYIAISRPQALIKNGNILS